MRITPTMLLNAKADYFFVLKCKLYYRFYAFYYCTVDIFLNFLLKSFDIGT